jgi:hypothetical protein
MRELVVDGRRAKQVVLDTRRDTVEELTFVESGDGRVLVVIAEAPAEHHAAYRRWFAAALRSLEVVESGEPAPDRDYREEAAGAARP